MKSFVRSFLAVGDTRWHVFVAGVLFAALLCAPLTVSAQTSGRIVGSVHDSQDAAIVGAKLTVTDTLRNTTRTTVTDDSGDFVVSDLPPSTYKVQIEAHGFNTYQAANVLIEVGKDVRVDATLKTGATTTVVTVDDQPPMLDLTTSTLGGTMSNKEINDLPLNGRSCRRFS